MYDDLLAGLGDGMAIGLQVGSATPAPTWSSGAASPRSSSASASRGTTTDRCCPAEDPRLGRGRSRPGGCASATCARSARRGVAHAVAHGPTASPILACSAPRAARAWTVILDVIADRVLLRVDCLFNNGEPDRLAFATMNVLPQRRPAAEPPS